ncbi:hypothetical protein E0H80_15130 [Acinetobacter sp. ANC 4779]|uniref:hypothetical protein n=1 Tax=Acinetobacter sp. ANC 4779 TaxID=2529848 RepID=UPI00103B3751|nr:hypothetical protein [Acinetobacter sp. ANC 4779]TCB48529.1 hypothetical protein E0H80_15130 [Acinetobacter sp. ANC 4779]
MTSSHTHLNDLLDKYQSRLNNAVIQAETQEVIEKSNIHNYEFDRKKLKPKTLTFINGSVIVVEQRFIKITSQIDFLNLSFKTTTPTQRSYIKKFLTEKIGKKHFIIEEREMALNTAPQNSYLNVYNIRIHDVINKKVIGKIVHALTEHYGAHDFRITCIELAHDFYNAPSELLTALFKSIKFDADVHSIRVFRLKGENKSIPFEPFKLKQLLLKGFNIGVNDYRTDDLYYHFYFKKTDHNKQPLPQKEWRLRAEVRLSNLTHNISDLQSLIKIGFKKLNFTQLNKSTTAEQRQLYSLYVRPYGQKQSSLLLRNGHYRYFKKFISVNKDLNERLRESVKNLSNKF